AAHTNLASRVRHVVEVAGRVGRVEIDGGMDDARLQSHHGGDEFHAAGGAEQVADHALGAADRDLARVGAEDALDGVGFGRVAELRARAVRIDVADIFGI